MHMTAGLLESNICSGFVETLPFFAAQSGLFANSYCCNLVRDKGDNYYSSFGGGNSLGFYSYRGDCRNGVRFRNFVCGSNLCDRHWRLKVTGLIGKGLKCLIIS